MKYFAIIGALLATSAQADDRPCLPILGTPQAFAYVSPPPLPSSASIRVDPAQVQVITRNSRRVVVTSPRVTLRLAKWVTAKTLLASRQAPARSIAKRVIVANIRRLASQLDSTDLDTLFSEDSLARVAEEIDRTTREFGFITAAIETDAAAFRVWTCAQ